MTKVYKSQKCLHRTANHRQFNCVYSCLPTALLQYSYDISKYNFLSMGEYKCWPWLPGCNDDFSNYWPRTNMLIRKSEWKRTYFHSCSGLDLHSSVWLGRRPDFSLPQFRNIYISPHHPHTPPGLWLDSKKKRSSKLMSSAPCHWSIFLTECALLEHEHFSMIICTASPSTSLSFAVHWQEKGKKL